MSVPAGRQRGRRKHPEPAPALPHLGVLAFERVRHLHARVAGGPVLLPRLPRQRDALLQRLRERPGQHHHPILVALGLAHDDHVAVEVHVLHAQPDRLHQAHAGAVQQPREQRRRLGHRVQQHLHLLARQHRRYATHRGGPLQVGHPRQLGAQHLLVEEQDRAQRLVVRGRRHVPLRGQHREKRLDLGLAHVPRMPQPRPAHEHADPVQIGLLGAQAVVQIPRTLTHLVQQSWSRRRHGEAAGLHFPFILYAHPVCKFLPAPARAGRVSSSAAGPSLPVLSRSFIPHVAHRSPCGISGLRSTHPPQQGATRRCFRLNTLRPPCRPVYPAAAG
jgi:hypothetical protein